MSTKETETEAAAPKTSGWRDDLNKPVRQSIEFFSEQSNLTKEQQSQIKGWVVAGTNKESLSQFNHFAQELGLKAEKTVLSNQGYGIDDLQLKGFQPGSEDVYEKLSKIAKELDLALWQEVDDIKVGHGAINQRNRKSTRLNSQSHHDLVCRLLLEKKKIQKKKKQIQKKKKTHHS